MVRAMIFIDGTWLGYVKEVLDEILQTHDLEIYERLPLILTKNLKDYLRASEVDLVRVKFFASIPVNVDPRDREEVEKQRKFYERLQKDFSYEIQFCETDFKGRRLHDEDRSPSNLLMLEEKCVVASLSVSMVYYAAINAYDVAVVVVGDQDYVHAFRIVRRLGKRVLIAMPNLELVNFY
jgi:uncharacterized LabA/DUF88 family protein